MCRISSPGAYSLCSANSTDWPWCGDLWSPVRTPSVMARTRSFSVPSLASTSGSRSEACARASITSGSGPHQLEQPLDDDAARHALALGVEVGEDAVDQHRFRQRADVVDAGGDAAVEDRARL